MISVVAVPIFPSASVTEQVWFPESIEWSALENSVESSLPSTKQLSAQVDVHW